jgi:hypothetical protein
MSMEDILKALMQSATTQQQQPQQQSGGGSDDMAQILGGLLGGSQQGGGGGDALSQVLGGLLGGGQQGGAAPASQVLGGLEQIIGMQSGASATPSSGDPLMTLLQPLVNQVAAKINISPAIATIIVSIALKYLLKSHPSTPDQSPLNLGSVMQTLASGGRLSESTVRTSGMLSEVVRTTGMDEQQALTSINTTFGVLGSSLTRTTSVQGGKIKKSTRGVKGKASVKRTRR